MKRSETPLQFVAAMATNNAPMRSRSSFRVGRKQWGRGFSDRPYNEGRGQQVVTGDSHFQSVRNSNLDIRLAGGSCFNPRQRFPRPPPRFNPNQQFRKSSPFVQNQNHQFRHSPRFDQNQAFRPPQQFRLRPAKPLDYREWEHTKTASLPDSEKFVVLSYNILADYLAFNHRSKLYFHIPRYILDWEWRKRNILFELNLWSADIMCFQEVDRFQDLAEELKRRGYDGIWKMRTGNAVDGCAIFWRTSRFKLLYEETVEFNRLGLRDNVAQICVLQLKNKIHTGEALDLPTSPASSDKVVICNIHVLYNPKRGEIKLGQVRTLLDKAYAVSQVWNAPVVLCGDFNCIPKSPLYNFISEQKLDLSGIDRDKVSGQASAEIRATRPYNSNPNQIPNPNFNPDPNPIWNPSSEISNQAPVKADNEVDNSSADMQKQNNLDLSDRNILDVSDVSSSVGQYGKVEMTICVEATKETQQYVIDNCKECPEKKGVESTISVLIHSVEENLRISHAESGSTDGQMNELIDKSIPDIDTNLGVENNGPSREHLAPSTEASSLESSSICYEGNKKLDGASPEEKNDFQMGGDMIGEDEGAFLSALHDTEDSFQPDFSQTGQPDWTGSQKELASDSIGSEVNSTSNEVLDDISLDLDSDSVEKTEYDPSLWTPLEIATATGNADCTILEHPLKLKSTYAEVQDCFGTRDSNGEPLVTSYNRCFLGTVDYIWSSEGLQTIRVLAPMPKHAMQWTPGFPTKKWGSDHIALASELAFTKHATDKGVEVQHHED